MMRYCAATPTERSLFFRRADRTIFSKTGPTIGGLAPAIALGVDEVGARVRAVHPVALDHNDPPELDAPGLRTWLPNHGSRFAVRGAAEGGHAGAGGGGTDAAAEGAGLTGIRDQLDNLLDEAGRANLSTREPLALLCEQEIARKDHRRIDIAASAGNGQNFNPGLYP
jgi:hypothetical protein